MIKVIGLFFVIAAILGLLSLIAYKLFIARLFKWFLSSSIETTNELRKVEKDLAKKKKSDKK